MWVKLYLKMVALFFFEEHVSVAIMLVDMAETGTVPSNENNDSSHNDDDSDKA